MFRRISFHHHFFSEKIPTLIATPQADEYLTNKLGKRFIRSWGWTWRDFMGSDLFIMCFMFCIFFMCLFNLYTSNVYIQVNASHWWEGQLVTLLFLLSQCVQLVNEYSWGRDSQWYFTWLRDNSPPLGRPARGWYVDIKKAELKFLDEKLHPPQEVSVAATEPSETEIGNAWRELYMEFIWVSEPKGAKMACPASFCFCWISDLDLKCYIILYNHMVHISRISRNFTSAVFWFLCFWEAASSPTWRGSRFLRPPKKRDIWDLWLLGFISDKCPNCENKCISESMFSLNDIWVQSMLNKRWICFYHLLSFKEDTLKSIPGPPRTLDIVRLDSIKMQLWWSTCTDIIFEHRGSVFCMGL